MLDLQNIDCMELMAKYPDDYFDLAIVDPPYGIKMDSGCDNGTVGKYGTKHNPKEWDSKTPDAEYWKELFRVSKKQIVWGANYFTEYLPTSKSWIVWDKKQPASNFAACELAWTNTDNRMRIFTYAFNIETNKIHPTQKPIKLYEWILHHYAKEGMKILDTHLGGGSIAIACHYKGYDLTGSEIDTEYFEKMRKRIEQKTCQTSLF